jgi:hypothetical protein
MISPMMPTTTAIPVMNIVFDIASVSPAQVDVYELRIRSCTTVLSQSTLRITVIFLRNTWLSITIVFLRVVYGRS